MRKRVAVTFTIMLAVAGGITISGGTANATYPGETNGRLAFGMTVDGNTDIYSVLPNGEGLKRLTTNPGFDAAFIGRPPGSTNVDIYVVDADGTGSGLVRLTDAPGLDRFPAW